MSMMPEQHFETYFSIKLKYVTSALQSSHLLSIIRLHARSMWYSFYNFKSVCRHSFEHYKEHCAILFFFTARQLPSRLNCSERLCTCLSTFVQRFCTLLMQFSHIAQRSSCVNCRRTVKFFAQPILLNPNRQSSTQAHDETLVSFCLLWDTGSKQQIVQSHGHGCRVCQVCAGLACFKGPYCTVYLPSL